MLFRSFAQSRATIGFWRDGWSAGLRTGPQLFLGDLGFTVGDSTGLNLGYSGWIGKQVGKNLEMRIQWNAGNLSGQGRYFDETVQDSVQARFHARVFDYDLSLVFGLSDWLRGASPYRKWNAWASVGVGFTNFLTDRYEVESDIPLGGSGHGSGSGMWGRTLETVIPVGLGLSYALTPSLSLDFGSSVRFYNTDLLDVTAAGIPLDAAWFTSAGISYRFRFPKTVVRQVLNYTTPPDRFLSKYNSLTPVTGTERKLSDGAMPEAKLVFPRMVGEVESFEAGIEIRNDRMAGSAEIEILLPVGFLLNTFDLPGVILDTSGSVIHLFIGLPPEDTLMVYTLEILSGKAPVGSHAFYTSRKFTDISGQNTMIRDASNVEKDIFYNPEGRKIPVVLPGVEFRVQLMSSAEGPVPLDKVQELFPVKEPIQEDVSDGFYQYTAGSFKTVAEAEQYRDRLRIELGREDLYVVFFQNGTRISNFAGARPRESYNREYEGTRSTQRVSLGIQDSRADEYRVEIRKSPEKKMVISEIASLFETPEPISEVYGSGVYYYYAGSFRKEEVARAYREYLADRYGMVTARIVRFTGGRRLE